MPHSGHEGVRSTKMQNRKDGIDIECGTVIVCVDVNNVLGDAVAAEVPCMVRVNDTPTASINVVEFN